MFVNKRKKLILGIVSAIYSVMESKSLMSFEEKKKALNKCKTGFWEA
jgi:hypothetical protein